MMEQTETGPQYPAEGGSKITGDPAREVDGQGLASSLATCSTSGSVRNRAEPDFIATGINLELAKEAVTVHSPATCFGMLNLNDASEGHTSGGLLLEPSAPKKYSSYGASSVSHHKPVPEVDAGGNKEGQHTECTSTGNSTQTGADLTETCRDVLLTGVDCGGESGEAPSTKRLTKNQLRRLRKRQAKESGMETDTNPQPLPSRKRKVVTGETPPGASSVGKWARTEAVASGAQESYLGAAEKSLQVAIVRGQDPSHRLSQLEYEHLQDQMIDASIAMNCAARFKRSGLVAGIFKVSCLDQTSLDWLQSAVSGFSGYNDLATRPYIVVQQDLVHLLKASLWVSGKALPARVVFDRLAVQNPGLCTDSWRWYASVPKEGGQTLVFGIDRASLDYLRMHDMKVYLVLNHVAVTVKLPQTDPGERTESRDMEVTHL